MHWLKLIRWRNLLIIAVTQFFTWACVLVPARALHPEGALLDAGNFFLLMTSTVLIAAAGYIINDYFDIRIDHINRPEKMVLEKNIPRRMAILLHSALNIAALLLAGLIIRRGAGSYHWLWMQLGCTVLLWFYSTHFKRQFMVGNVVVALLTSLTLLILLLYEPALHYFLFRPPFVHLPEGAVIPNPVWVLFAYTCFAFVLTWMREIVKDMEDYIGDEAEGCRTMPIVWGLKRAGLFVCLLGVVALVPLVIAATALVVKKDYLFSGYILIALLLPLICWLFFLPGKHTTAHYGKASRYLKWIMISGICTLLIYYVRAHY